ncbi:MAG TPA: diguanylate cyclase [Candidatus Acidoferrum sp.]|nr:diguanylate cyclase [Candidatus Acidoferrum sp.]
MRKNPAFEIAKTSKRRHVANQKNADSRSSTCPAMVPLIVDQIPAIIWTTDAALRITSSLGAPLHSLNLPPDELKGKPLFEFLEVENPSAPQFANHLEALQSGTLRFDANLKGRVFRVCIEPLKDVHSRVIGTVAVALDITDHHRSEESIKYQALHDPLTGLANYRALLEAFDTELHRSDRTGRPFAVVLLDLDGLKVINDRYGHLVGSRALSRLSAILKRTCRSIDTSARYGGDEFAVLLVETDQAAAMQVARRIVACLANDSENPRLSVSAGIAVYPRDGDRVESLLAVADRDLYRKKLRKALREKACAAESSTQGTDQAEWQPERRRSERLLLDVPLLVSGKDVAREPFQEETFSVSISPHGALLILGARVARGQTLSLINRQTRQEIEGTVAGLGSEYGGLSQVAIEFSHPALKFWNLDPMPHGWNTAVEVERKMNKKIDAQ